MYNAWVSRCNPQVHTTSCGAHADAERMAVDRWIFIIETMEKLRQVCPTDRTQSTARQELTCSLSGSMVYVVHALMAVQS